MNAITSSRRSLAADIGEPKFSSDLERAIDRFIDPFPGVDRGVVTISVSEEAARHMEHYSHLCRSAAAETVITWLWPIVASSSNPPDQVSFKVRAAAIAKACERLPEAAFTLDSQREAMGTFKFFPGAAEVIEFLKPNVVRLRSRKRALEALAATDASSQAKAASLTDLQRDEILAAFRPRFAAAVASARSTADSADSMRSTGRPKARHLSPGQLAAAYRQAAASAPPEQQSGFLARALHIEEAGLEIEPNS